MSAMMTPVAEATIDELRDRLRSCEVDATRLRAQLDEREREARGLRVTIAKRENGTTVQTPPAPEVLLRDYAMKTDVFNEQEAIEHTGLTKGRLRPLIERLIGEGKMLRIGTGPKARCAWVKPDSDASAPERRAFADAAPALPRRRGDSVAGTGKGKKVTGNRNVRALTRSLEQQGAQVTKMGNGHIQIRTEADVITMSATPRSQGLSRTKSQARNRLGLQA